MILLVAKSYITHQVSGTWQIGALYIKLVAAVLSAPGTPFLYSGALLTWIDRHVSAVNHGTCYDVAINMEFTLTVAMDKIMSSWFDMFAPGLNHTMPLLMRSEVCVMVVVT